MDVAAPSVHGFSSPEGLAERCDHAVAAFLNHRIVTHLLRQLSIAKIDLKTLSVSKHIWEECSTSTVVPALPVGSDDRITLDNIAAALDAHRAIQRRIVALLAKSFPASFLVMFGQGIALAHPGYYERFSHDIDLVIASPAEGEAIASALCDLGFVTSEARSGSYRDVTFNDWCLDAPNLDGHKMHVDLSTGAITRSDGWMRPVVLPDLFESAVEVAVEHPVAHTVLVPSDTSQLVLLAEKAQRTQRFDGRVRCDATILAREGVLDTAAVVEAVQQAGLTSALRWAMPDKWRQENESPYGWRDRTSSPLIAAMANRTRHPSPLHDVASRIFRRLWM